MSVAPVGLRPIRSAFAISRENSAVASSPSPTTTSSASSWRSDVTSRSDDEVFAELYARLGRPFEVLSTLSALVGEPPAAVAQGVGLDEIGFAGSENSALGAVTLGKKLTEQLSIRFEQTLGGTAGSLLRIDYMLSERWRLRGTAGAENAGDILFTLRFD